MSRNRRRTRLRSTALPTCFETVKPTRATPSSARRRACTTKQLADARTPVAAARNSLRRLNRSTVMILLQRAPASRTQPLAALRATRGHDFAAALGRHARAKTMASLAHQFARLISPFHGCFSAARPLNRLSARPFPAGRPDAITDCTPNPASESQARPIFAFCPPARDWRGLYGRRSGSSMRSSCGFCADLCALRDPRLTAQCFAKPLSLYRDPTFADVCSNASRRA